MPQFDFVKTLLGTGIRSVRVGLRFAPVRFKCAYALRKVVLIVSSALPRHR